MHDPIRIPPDAESEHGLLEKENGSASLVALGCTDPHAGRCFLVAVDPRLGPGLTGLPDGSVWCYRVQTFDQVPNLGGPCYADGTVAYDNDGDEVTEAQGDCDDDDAWRYPGAEELCNGRDDDCDGLTDDDSVGQVTRAASSPCGLTSRVWTRPAKTSSCAAPSGWGCSGRRCLPEEP
ncbi:MAG: hypothetical protein FJ125_15020 [Deltaproteobacteria bacterium]|nr:hypothetical protein [Deltaproteobacteria bacterium]